MIKQLQSTMGSFNVSRFRAVMMMVIILSLLVGGCADAGQQNEPRPVTVQLSWFHYANFAGFYMADQNGLYSDHGLEVDFLEAGPETDYLQPVIDKEAQFGVASAEVLMSAQAEGLPLVAVGAILHENPAVLVSKEEHDLDSLEDLRGQRIRVTNQVTPIVKAFLVDNDIPLDQVELVTLPSTTEAFDSEGATVWTIYSNSFAVTLEERGYQLDYFYPADYGVHFLGEVIIVHQDLLEEDPALIQAFMEATLAGYRQAIEQADQVGGLVSQYDPSVDEALETAKWQRTIPLILPLGNPLGWINETDWETMRQELIKHSDLEPGSIPSGGFTNQFIDQAPNEAEGQIQ